MKRTLYIDSIDRKIDGQPGRWYAPVYQYSEYIFNLLDKCNVACERVNQMSDKHWSIVIKGKKKNVRTFITNLSIEVAGMYNVREYG